MRYALLLVVATCLTIPLSVKGKTFRKLTLEASLCAVDQPSKTFPLEAVRTFSFGSMLCVPPNAMCAWVCNLEENCTGFNYNSTLDQCELFFYTPLNYAPSDLCAFYKVTIHANLFLLRGITMLSYCKSAF